MSYIERESFQKSISRNRYNFKDMRDVEYAWMMAQIEPAADVVEVKHGKWTETGDNTLDNLYCGWKCSKCGFAICGDRYNYCPNCGAKMDGERKCDNDQH